MSLDDGVPTGFKMWWLRFQWNWYARYQNFKSRIHRIHGQKFTSSGATGQWRLVDCPKCMAEIEEALK